MAYIKYSKTLKNIMSDERYLLVLTLNYVVALPGLTIFQLQSNIVMAMGQRFKQSTTSKPA